MAIFTMFFIELMAARFDVFGNKSHTHDLEASDPSKRILEYSEKHKEKISTPTERK